jgi:homoserine O-acetyltransferase
VGGSYTGADILYREADQVVIVETHRENGNHVEYREITSIHGHDAFLTEWDQMSEEIGPFLAGAE